jgi:zinc transporter ZupT
VEAAGPVLSAFAFGLVASSALVIGAVAGAYWTPPRLLLAASLAFASGALITALAFDLFRNHSSEVAHGSPRSGCSWGPRPSS